MLLRVLLAWWLGCAEPVAISEIDSTCSFIGWLHGLSGSAMWDFVSEDRASC